MTEREQYWREFGWRLRVTRAALNISENEAADVFWVTLLTYRRMEAGERTRPMHRAVDEFVKKYNLTVDWVIAGDPAGLRFTPPPLPAELAPQPKRNLKISESGVINFDAWKARRSAVQS
jgi:hypothetical protein